eukprot:8361104-Pyramimonas_sp.AAC.1
MSDVVALQPHQLLSQIPCPFDLEPSCRRRLLGAGDGGYPVDGAGSVWKADDIVIERSIWTLSCVGCQERFGTHSQRDDAKFLRLLADGHMGVGLDAVE